MSCRHCHGDLTKFLDLGYAPPSNAYLDLDQLSQPEVYFPLRISVCERCWLVQTDDFSTPEQIFTKDYAYFSSTSSTWLEHAESYSEMIIQRLGLDRNSSVVEIAANDGYLLKNFKGKNIPCYGVEPTASTAKVCRSLGIDVVEDFFGKRLAEELVLSAGAKPNLIIANNVLAHVPDINDFIHGLKILLDEQGVITVEFPHFLELIKNNQFDTIYHEHYSYLSLIALARIFESYGLIIFDVEKILTHGGSLRIYVTHKERSLSVSDNFEKILAEEQDFGLQNIGCYMAMQDSVNAAKNGLLDFLIQMKKAGRMVYAYGAAAKGNTLLNYAGVKSDLICGIFDAAKAKQNKFMPGSHIQIYDPKLISNFKIDCLVLLPWNLTSEVMQMMRRGEIPKLPLYIAIPEMRLIE